MTPRLEIRMTETMGRGVFACAPIAAGEELGTWHTLHIPPTEVSVMAGTEISRFWFEDEADGGAFVVFGMIELVNHSRDPNCDRRWTMTEAGEVVTLYAIRPIPAGEQLTMDYKFDGKPGDPAWA